MFGPGVSTMPKASRMKAIRLLVSIMAHSGRKVRDNGIAGETPARRSPCRSCITAIPR